MFSIVLLLANPDSSKVGQMPSRYVIGPGTATAKMPPPEVVLSEERPLERSGRSEYGRGRLLRWMYQDLGPLAARAVAPRTLLYSAGTFGATLGLAQFDDDLIEAGEGVSDGSLRDALDVVDYLGGPFINGPVVAIAGISLLTGNDRLQDAAFTSLQTLIYAGLLGYALKGVFGRARPEWTHDPYKFFSTTGKNPFSHEGNSSYPGGHAISSFGIITPWVLYYPGPLTYSLYALPIGTAVSRVVRKKHWPTDLAVGAAIGVAMGHWLTRRHQKAREKSGTVEIYYLERGAFFGVRMDLE
jgi:membrane-associated phospholipid phosphatase